MLDMTLKSVVDFALNSRAWQATGQTMRNRIRDCVNLVLMDVSTRAPSALSMRTAHVFAQKQYKSSDEDVAARINATADRRVMLFTLPSGAILNDWTPTINGSWDHVMHLEVTRSDGVVERRQCLEFWLEDRLNFTAGYYVTLDREWRNTTDTLMHFRIYQPAIWLPKDVYGLETPVEVWDAQRNRPLVASVHDVERRMEREFRGDIEGPIEYIYPGRDMFIPISPKTAPTTAPSGTSNTWSNAGWQEGSYKFIQTFVVAKTDPRWQDSPGSNAQDPIFESAPSAPSAVHAHSTAANSGRAITINLSTPAQMLNFYDTSALRHGHSGYRTRIYVAQSAVRPAGRGLSAFNSVDADDVYYLLDEVEDTVQSYSWTGTVYPDRLRRLSPATGYRPWNIYPNPDQQYELDLSCKIRPEQLVNDYDTIPLDPGHFKGFISGVIAQVAEQDGVDLKSRQQYMREYDAWIRTVIRDLNNPVGRVEQPMWATSPWKERRINNFRLT